MDSQKLFKTQTSPKGRTQGNQRGVLVHGALYPISPPSLALCLFLYPVCVWVKNRDLLSSQQKQGTLRSFNLAGCPVHPLRC